MTSTSAAAADPADEPAAAPAGEQLALVRGPGAPGEGEAAAAGPAEVDPVARVAVDVPCRTSTAPSTTSCPSRSRPRRSRAPGCACASRARSSTAGCSSAATDTEHVGRLERIAKVVSPDPVLAPEVVELAPRRRRPLVGHARRRAARGRARRGTPPPRPRSTRAAPGASPSRCRCSTAPGGWAAYAGGTALIDRLADPALAFTPRRRARARSGPPDLATSRRRRSHGWCSRRSPGGRGVLVVAPDARDVARLDAALHDRARPRAPRASSPPTSARRRATGASSRSAAGTGAWSSAPVLRSFAPVADLGLVVLWDDGDDSLAEPRAPYSHAREVLAPAPTLGGTALVRRRRRRAPWRPRSSSRTGWAREVAMPAGRACAAGTAGPRLGLRHRPGP